MNYVGCGVLILFAGAQGVTYELNKKTVSFQEQVELLRWQRKKYIQQKSDRAQFQQCMDCAKRISVKDGAERKS